MGLIQYKLQNTTHLPANLIVHIHIGNLGLIENLDGNTFSCKDVGGHLDTAERTHSNLLAYYVLANLNLNFGVFRIGGVHSGGGEEEEEQKVFVFGGWPVGAGFGGRGLRFFVEIVPV